MLIRPKVSMLLKQWRISLNVLPCAKLPTFTLSQMFQSKIIILESILCRGMPYRNCTVAVKEYIDHNFPIWSAMFFLFSAALLTGLIASFIMCCCYKNEKGSSYANIIKSRI